MSKLLENLLQKAQVKGEAVRNGRKVSWYGDKGDLEERYAIVVDDNIVRLRHWGTETLVVDTSKKKVLEWHGESNSDRDSMNFIINRFGLGGRFRYRPSVGEFSYNELL